VAVNQGVNQKIKKIDPFVKNFWGGLTTVVLCLIGLAIFGSLHLLIDFSQGMQKLWLASLLIGGNVVALWTFNLLSYKHGASIALKKLVMNGSFLSMSMILGIVIFGETASLEKMLGVLIYLAAFCFMDTKAWEYFKSLLSKKKHA